MGRSTAATLRKRLAFLRQVHSEAVGSSNLAKVAPDVGLWHWRRSAENATGCGKTRGTEERRVWLRQCGNRDVWIFKIEGIGKIRHIIAGVAQRQRSETPTPLDQLQDGGMVEHQIADPRIVRLSGAEGRGDHGGNAEAQKRFSVDQIRVDIVWSRGSRRRGVLEEAAPFVKIHDKDSIGPLRPSRDGLECVVKEAISFANVGVRMVVVSGAVVENGVNRVHKGNRGQRSGGCGNQEICVGPGDAKMLRSP